LQSLLLKRITLSFSAQVRIFFMHTRRLAD
jgi:hypothetical protein